MATISSEADLNSKPKPIEGFPQNLAVSSCAVIDLLLTFGSRAPSPAASTAKPAEVAASGAPSAFQASTPGARLASQAGFEVTGPALASTTPGSTVFSSLTRLNLAEHAGSFTGGSVARTRSTSCSESLFEPVRLLSSGLRGEPVSWAATACAPLGCTQAQLGLAAPLNVRQACRAADDSAPLYQTSDLAAMVASRGFPPRQLERLESVVSSDVDGKRELETEVEEEEETTEKAVKAQRVEIEEDQVEEDELLRSGGAERREEDVKVIAKSKECVNEEEMDWAQRFRLKYSQTEVPERLASELIKPGLLGLDTASQLRPSKIGCDLGAITATAPAYAATFTDSESNKGACHNKDRKGIVEDSGLELIVNQTNSEKSLEEATDNCLELRPPGGLDDYCDLYGYGNYAEHCAFVQPGDIASLSPYVALYANYLYAKRDFCFHARLRRCWSTALSFFQRRQQADYYHRAFRAYLQQVFSLHDLSSTQSSLSLGLPQAQSVSQNALSPIGIGFQSGDHSSITSQWSEMHGSGFLMLPPTLWTPAVPLRLDLPGGQPGYYWPTMGELSRALQLHPELVFSGIPTTPASMLGLYPSSSIDPARPHVLLVPACPICSGEPQPLIRKRSSSVATEEFYSVIRPCSQKSTGTGIEEALCPQFVCPQCRYSFYLHSRHNAYSLSASKDGPSAPQPPSQSTHFDGQVICSVCRLLVRGLVVLCPDCYHGGHPEHLAVWFARPEFRKQIADRNCQDGPAGFIRPGPACPCLTCDCTCPQLFVSSSDLSTQEHCIWNDRKIDLEIGA